MDTHPGDGNAERLHEYWVHGEGAAKIRWGTEGAHTRCHKLLMEHAHMTSDQAWGYCQLAGHAATGKYSGEQTALEKGHGRMLEVASKTEASAQLEAPIYHRAAPLEDISIRSSGDGRTVEAYAAVFDTPATISDRDGEYVEVLDRTAFNRAIRDAQPSGGRKGWRVRVLYNHGQDIHGHPSDRFSVPIGTPVEIRPDGRGLYTVTRFHKTSLADEVLEWIREGSIEGYSFSGQFRASDPSGPRPFRKDRKGNLRTVRRMESTLREYGPTMFPYYEESTVEKVRSVEEIVEAVLRMPSDERIRLASVFSARAGALSDSPGSDAPDDSGLVAEDSRRLVAEMRSGRPPREEFQARMAEFLIEFGGGRADG